MLSKRVIMNEWRDFVRLRNTNTNTRIYVDRPAPGPDGGARPGSPARAPASLTDPYAS